MTDPIPGPSRSAGRRVHLPAAPRGAALTAAVHQIRRALAEGGVVVDSREAAAWSPGPRLVLDRLRAVGERRGRTWRDLAERPATGTP